MKLYYSPGACSLAPHICLLEAGLDFELEKVDMRTRQVADGGDYRRINWKGYVPALELDDGELLSEVAAIVQYIADRNPDSGLAPPAGSMARYQLQEWLNFIATELHKGFGPLVRPGVPQDYRGAALAHLEGRLTLVDGQLGTREFLLGEHFTVADAYLHTVLGWTGYAGIDRTRWPALERYYQRIAQRPAVKAARRDEGLPA